MIETKQPDHVSLGALLNRLRSGRYVIPDFQRDFEWTPRDILELMRSIFSDYYIGSLLLWKGKAASFDALKCQPLHGFAGKSHPTHIVLDGQQRLTAMHYAFLAPPEPPPNRVSRFLYFIRVDRLIEEDYEGAFTYDWTKKGRTLLSNRSAQFEAHQFPVSVVGQGGYMVATWVHNYRQHWHRKEEAAHGSGDDQAAQEARRHTENAGAFGAYLEELTSEYQVSYIELDRDMAIDKVCAIFTQVNSHGVPLDVFDLMNAMLRPKDLRLKAMWHAARDRLSFVGADRMNVYLLQVMSILRQAYCSPRYLYYLIPGQQKVVRNAEGIQGTEVLITDASEFERQWHDAVRSVENAIERLRNVREFGVISSKYIPYASIIPAFAALQTAIDALPPAVQGAAYAKLYRWYWASVFTNRYSRSVESTTARDFLDMKTWFRDNAAEPRFVSEARARVMDLDLMKVTRRGTSIYNGIFNLLVLKGARDWITHQAPQHSDLDDHHIVPKSWASNQTIASDANMILNRTPLTANTNRTIIRDRLPNQFLPDLIQESGEDGVRKLMDSHFISPEAIAILRRVPFTSDDFVDFLTERQRTLRRAVLEALKCDLATDRYQEVGEWSGQSRQREDET